MTAETNGTESTKATFMDLNLGRLKLSPPERIIFLCVSVPFILHTIFSNSLVIHAIRKYSSLRNPCNMFLLSLAVTDLTCGLLVMPVACYYSWLGEWPFRMEECRLWLFTTVFLSTCSIYHLCVISVDRYLAIAHPVVYFKQRSISNSFKIIGFVWAASFTLVFPTFFGSFGFDYPDTFERDTPCAGLEDNAVVIFTFLSIIFMPLLIFLGMYCGLYKKNKDRQKKKNSLHSNKVGGNQVSIEKVKVVNLRSDLPGNEESGKVICEESEDITLEAAAAPADIAMKVIVVTGSKRRMKMSSTEVDELLKSPATSSLPNVAKCQSCETVTYNREEEEGGGQSMEEHEDQFQGQNSSASKSPDQVVTAAEQQKIKILVARERRYILMTVVIICVFAISFLPCFAVLMVPRIFPSVSVSPFLTSLAWWLQWVNSSTNPIIYTALNQDFRQAFQATFKEMFKGEKAVAKTNY